MPVSVPPLTLKASTPQTNVTSYSTDDKDLPTLEKLSSLIPNLTSDDQAALIIATTNEAFEPDAIAELTARLGHLPHLYTRPIQIFQKLRTTKKAIPYPKNRLRMFIKLSRKNLPCSSINPCGSNRCR